ncbi:MAG: Lrp/AsnC family transcriptional regulator [Candidatus Aenigmarchaeota archaeon]|nr:Lrp/AsnC family transcriptional regulator [Candidatus Aenigmarchaeota archaeon]
MPAELKGSSQKIRQLDEKDRRILNILAENARTKLTQIARHVQLSIDSTKKRIEKLEKDGVIAKYTIQPNPDKYGLPLGIHIYIKLMNVTKERYDEFISTMKKNPRIIDLMSMLGDYDVYIVLLAKDTIELDKMKIEIKQKFSDIIADWKEVLVTQIYKLEEYRF